jgi:hypothetical protein
MNHLHDVDYSLVEYDLEFEALKAMKGQVLADFIVELHIAEDGDICTD